MFLVPAPPPASAPALAKLTDEFNDTQSARRLSSPGSCTTRSTTCTKQRLASTSSPRYEATTYPVFFSTPTNEPQLTNRGWVVTDHVPRGPDGTTTAVGHGGTGAIPKLDSFIHPRLKRCRCRLRYLQYGKTLLLFLLSPPTARASPSPQTRGERKGPTMCISIRLTTFYHSCFRCEIIPKHQKVD